MPLNDTLSIFNKAVLEPRVSPAFAITYFFSHCNISQTPMVIYQNMWIEWLFFKNFTKWSMTPRWPLTPLLLTSHVWLYPRIIVSKSHENTSKCVDTLTCFSKTWTKGHWPLDDFWPHICWGHIGDYPRMIVSKSHENTTMYVDTVISFCKIPHTYYIHTVHTYILRTEWVITQSLSELSSGETKMKNNGIFRCQANHLV